MAITTYADLQSEISTWMIRTDMTAMAPKFIALAEDRFNRALRTPEMEEQVTATISDGTVALPTDFLQARSVYLNTDYRIALEQMNVAQLAATYDNQGEGTPIHYALQSGNEMVFGPTPDEDYDVVLNYFQQIPALSDGNTSNWLLTAHSDLYLAASLAEGFAFTVDSERGPYWEGKTMQKLDELQRQGVAKAYSAAPLRARLRSGTPSYISRL